MALGWMCTPFFRFPWDSFTTPSQRLVSRRWWNKSTRMTRWTNRLNKHAVASALLVSWAVALQFHVWHVKQSLENQREDDLRHQGTRDGHVQP